MATLMNSISINEGELIIKSEGEEIVLFKGKPYGINVEKVVRIPNSTDLIVLLNNLQTLKMSKKNLIRINNSGEVKWEIGSPKIKKVFGIIRKENEPYLDVHYFGKLLKAYSVTGFSDTVDLQTGELLNSEFVK